ncbi:MFS transporter [Aurantimonas sp. C2-6-R+9]|uniref:MFS transporter n=1 Tax=unclassified Aurantimonas TaxID=2638230 RepID=UPI002E19FBFD|nr:MULTISPECIES: MFS transporter [unclassified Aurantimonas]MEC5291353.1 MFS transporter [Aurantimonas sp. C2-3-R2]MEC5381559.1 MFS transporter [Aurantimonas sp. C2-6-R+9]MEC5412440.1 MFS transporter [Aurantimonas sp. C2-4-R8]
MSATTSTTRGATRPWIAIAAGCAIALLTFGPRSAIGFFQIPMLAEHGWSREDFAIAIAIQNLFWGAGQPIFGAIADRFGTGRVLILSGFLYAVGLGVTAIAPTPFWLTIGSGVLVGLGVAAGSFGIVLAAFARRVTPEQRSFVFGLGTAAGSAGMFLFAPLSQALIDSYGWSDSLLILSAMMLLVPLFAYALRGNSRTSGNLQAEVEQTMGAALREAFATKSYLLLTTGFFVCGFQVAFITAHFPAYIADLGMAPVWAVTALSLIGFFNIIGSIGSGLIGQRYSKPHFLALIYIGRSIAVTIFLLTPQTPATVVVFSTVMGLLWLSTVPPTNALVAIMFGTRYLGLLGGLVFLSHQIGSFLGVWLGGYLYVAMGSYDPVWWLGVILGLIAAVVHWPIREAPVERELLPA